MGTYRHALASALWVALGGGLAGGFVAGCATGGGQPAAPARSNLAAADYYPLAVGWKWAFDVQKEGQNILATYTVLERIGETAIIQSGEERLMYAITPEGIAQREGGAVGDYLIKNPIAVGSAWPVAGGTAKVVSVSEEVTVPAGHYTGCAVIETARANPERLTRTTFAPEVGPAVVEVLVQGEDGRFVTTTRAALRTFTKPGEDLFQ